MTQFFRREQMSQIISSHVCEVGEGPTFDPATGTLWWFDIIGRKLLEFPLDSARTIIHELPRMASAMAVIDGSRQLLAMEDGLYIRDIATGSLRLHHPLEADKPANRSNDARVHPSGAFWIGTMGKKAERKAGAIYWFRGGELKRLYPDISIPNSICFSPDGSLGYFCDSMDRRMMRVDCDPATGLPIGEPMIFANLADGEGGDMDGSVCDGDGNVWNARWGGACVDVYAPSGARIATHEVAASQPSCPVFFGPDASSLAVTTAWQGMDPSQRDADPLAGQLHKIEVTVRGRFEPVVMP
jgi:sugar lactone lactonase YvrE